MNHKNNVEKVEHDDRTFYREAWKGARRIHCREPVLTLTSDGPRDDSTGRRSSRRENLRGFFISLTFGMKAEVCSTGWLTSTSSSSLYMLPCVSSQIFFNKLVMRILTAYMCVYACFMWKKIYGNFYKNDDSTQIIFSLGKGIEFSMYLQGYIKKKKRNKSRSTKHS